MTIANDCQLIHVILSVFMKYLSQFTSWGPCIFVNVTNLMSYNYSNMESSSLMSIAVNCLRTCVIEKIELNLIRSDCNEFNYDLYQLKRNHQYDSLIKKSRFMFGH